MTFTYVPPDSQIWISIFLKFPVLKKPSHQPGIVIILSQTRIKFPKTWSAVERVFTVKLDRHQVMIRMRARIKSIPKGIRNHASWGINSINPWHISVRLVMPGKQLLLWKLIKYHKETTILQNLSVLQNLCLQPMHHPRLCPALDYQYNWNHPPKTEVSWGMQVSISLKRTLTCP